MHLCYIVSGFWGAVSNINVLFIESIEILAVVDVVAIPFVSISLLESEICIYFLYLKDVIIGV